MLNLPHGVCNAVLLPYVMEFNGSFPEMAERFKKVAQALGIPSYRCMQGEDLVHACTRFIRDLSHSLSLPESLKELGTGMLDYETLAETAMRDVCMKDNFFMPAKSQVVEVYRRAFEHKS
jgi:alcohol dehydrogenase